MPEAAPQRFSDHTPMGQYYLLEKISQGGMAEIYKGLAYDLHGIKRTVVIKRILPQAAAHQEFIDMLIAEAKIAVMLSHGNIAQIYDLGKAGEDYFIVMEYVDGYSLSRLQRLLAARGERLPIAMACSVIADAAAGLDYMHSRTDERGQPLLIIHRDVSPQNIMVSSSGTVKIIDFGIAKARTKLETTDIGILKGKFAYMSPEQARGELIDHRSDIFSLGVILHELLTGERLFKAKDPKETLRNVRRTEVAAPSQQQPELPAELDRIVLKALARAPADRYGRAASLRDDLIKLVHQWYPDFRRQELVEYVRALFIEAGGATAVGEEVKTPFLIIDHTQSALGRAVVEEHTAVQEAVPTALAEYMQPFGAEPVVAPSTEAGKIASILDEPSVTATELSVTLRWRQWWVAMRDAWRRWRQRYLSWRRAGAAAGTALLLAVGLSWYLGAWAPTTLWQAWRARAQRAHIVQTLPPLPTATIQITSDPPGAEIFLDDRQTGLRTPQALPGLAIGRTYQLGLYLADHQYVRMTITPKDAPEDTIAVPLVVDYATLKIQATPVGARVVVNGRGVGRSPWTQERIQPGEIMQIRVEHPGYQAEERRVRMEAGRTTELHFVLIPTETE